MITNSLKLQIRFIKRDSARINGGTSRTHILS